MHCAGLPLNKEATEQEAQALLHLMGNPKLKNDQWLVATAHKHGSRFATGGKGAMLSARRLMLAKQNGDFDVRFWRLKDDGGALANYRAVLDQMAASGLTGGTDLIGPLNPW
jgi:hypothetical protein